jgi:pimeloyl-ACP methyl ester carboxylesterase
VLKINHFKIEHQMKSKILFTILAIMFVGSAFAQDFGADFKKSKYGKNPKAGHYVKIRGFNMYYETYGKGEPLLIIHGNGGSINHFTYQIPYFAKHYKVIVADSRAHGKSIDTQDSLSYEMMADDFNALLDALHLDSCYVIGWSDGGINGLLLAMRHPEKVKKLAATGANLWPDSSAVDATIAKWALATYDSIASLPQTPEIKHMRKLYNLLCFNPHIKAEALKSIQCPTLIIGGDHDVILPKHTMLIAASIPKSYLWILPNSGHSTPINFKNEFNKTVGDFFKKPYRVIEGPNRLN